MWFVCDYEFWPSIETNKYIAESYVYTYIHTYIYFYIPINATQFSSNHVLYPSCLNKVK